MGHAIDYLHIKDGKNAKDEIRWVADDWYAANHDWGENPSSVMPDRITYYDQIFDTEEEAHEFIERKDYDYAQIAVRFKDYSKVKKPAKLVKAKESLVKAEKDYQFAASKFHFAEHKAAFIGCPHCASKLNAEHLKQRRRNACPVCGKDMRPQTTLNTLENKKTKIADMRKKVATMEREWKKASLKKGEVRWIVKVECHC